MFDEGKDSDLYMVSMCGYFTLANLHYIFIISYTKNWTIWIVFMYSMSYLLFCPFFIFIYNGLFSSAIEGRLIELIFGNRIFWFMMILLVIILMIPVLFYQKI